MKLQHLTIIFIIIILPISLIISEYTQTQIDSISLQTKYSSKLTTATHDAIKSFQLNTLNNKYSTLSDSKIRDIEASVNTFYNSLGTELGASGYDTESLQQFIPAIVYTMYDGYYIYGKYYNEQKHEYQYGLRPYIYYSCRYKTNDSNYDFVVNYTLDNSITIYGKVKEKINGREEINYVTKTGTFIDYSKVTNIREDGKGLEYDGIKIEPEILKEQLVILDENNNPYRVECEYTTYNSQKIYYDGANYFLYDSRYKKQDFSDVKMWEFVRTWTYNGHLHSNSAIEYFKKAKEFSEWVHENLSTITQQDAKDENGSTITDFVINTENEPIFKLSNENNPLLESSIFNQNRISVIRRTIQTTLNTAIANYSSNANYEFVMPKLSEEEWEKLENNISVAAFMQGLPIGSKYYNNYCIITNNKNKEIINKESIYIITEDGEVHRAASKEVIDKNKKVTSAYKSVDFEMQTVVITEGDERYYYPHANNRCYTCMVSATQTYNIDDIINGEVKIYNKNKDTFEKDNSKSQNIKNNNLRKTYLTALARERYDLYRTNGYFINN